MMDELTARTRGIAHSDCPSDRRPRRKALEVDNLRHERHRVVQCECRNQTNLAHPRDATTANFSAVLTIRCRQ